MNNSKGLKIDDRVVADQMLSLLLAAPYHMKSLLDRNIKETGISMLSYTPYNREEGKNKGYVLVATGALGAKGALPPKQVNNVLSYPCNDTAHVAPGLFNESPNPFGNTRNLANNPVGHPIYINLPSAKKIEVSNIKYIDVARKIEIPVHLLDQNSDPHKNTSNKVEANEAFIIPLTDSLNSCENKKGNCGLYGNSKYQVKYDVLVDGSKLESKTINFSTADQY